MTDLQYRREKIRARTRRDTYQSLGMDPDQHGAVYFIAALIAAYPFVKFLVSLIGASWTQRHEVLIDSASGVVTLATVYHAVRLYKRVKAPDSLLSEGATKDRLDDQDKAELLRLLDQHRGRHVEIAFSDVAGEILAMDLIEQFNRAKWNVGDMGGFYRKTEHKTGIWICGTDSEGTEKIIGAAFHGIFLPYRTDTTPTPNPGIRVFVGRPLS